MNSPAQTTDRPTNATALRAGLPHDAERCGEIFFDAFESIAARHNLPVEPGSPEFTRFMAGMMLEHDEIAAIVAERGSEIVGSAFIDERGLIAGIGPVTVDPAAQDGGVGRLMMRAALERCSERGAVGVRLVQTAYHYRSFALYSKLGFVVREPLSVLHGEPPPLSVPGRSVRSARDADLSACDALCVRVHGHDRHGELRDAIAAGSAAVVERPDRICGYATGFGYGYHAVAETNEDLIALLGSAESIAGLGVLVPSRNSELLGWCLSSGLRLVQQSTLMTIGLYNEPAGAWLPSIAY
jgi:predicted N-acetyltransferase YhbS